MLELLQLRVLMEVNLLVHGGHAMLSLVMSAGVTIVWTDYLSCQQGLALHLLHPHQSWRPPLLFWQLPCPQSWQHCQAFWRILLLPLAGLDPPKAQSCRARAFDTRFHRQKHNDTQGCMFSRALFPVLDALMLIVHHLLNTCLPLGSSMYSPE